MDTRDMSDDEIVALLESSLEILKNHQRLLKHTKETFNSQSKRIDSFANQPGVSPHNREQAIQTRLEIARKVEEMENRYRVATDGVFRLYQGLSAGAQSRLRQKVEEVTHSKTTTAMNYSRFLSAVALARKPSPIRELTKMLVSAPPSLIFLAGGVPNPELFPFKNLSVSLADGSEIVLESNTMKSALQYTETKGYPNLVKHLLALQNQLHKPHSNVEWDIAVTNGSQDGLCKAIEMLVQPGDFMLLEEPCYAGTLSILHPFSPKWLPLSGDEQGLIPTSLREALSKWTPDLARSVDNGVPKVLYLNPNGANPTGTSISRSRREEIYKIAQDYDLIILEDDPYYFLQFQKEKLPSFLSLDTDGRVLRFDSFSKILSSGIRLGFVTGPKELVERIILHMQVSVLHASTLSQVLVSELFDRWQIEGFLSHADKVASFYEKQRDHMASAAQKYLTGLAEWNIPAGGMFLWMKCLAVKDTRAMIMERALAKDVILLPGQAFMTDPTEPSPYMRAAFSLATPEKMDAGFQKLAELIKEEIELQKKDPQ